MSSNAVAQNRISSVVGYQLAAANFNTISQNLPQSIAILGEVNTANQGSYPTNPTQILSAKQAGDNYGYGSPIYAVARILFPIQGGGTNAPVWVYPQAAAVSSVARVQTVTITGTATAGGTHYVNIAGRNNIDGNFYAVNIVSGDTPTVIAGKMRDCINAVTASPVIATASAGIVTLTAKWTGLTSETITVTVDTSLAPGIGETYVIAETVAGSGTPAVTASLNLFSSQWNTIVINCYGTVTTTMTELEVYNGIPGLTGSTGRYQGIIFKPFIALTGSVADDPTSITSARSTQCTIALCPAPQSPGMQYEAAANMAVIFSNLLIDTPNLDVLNLTYPDMPIPAATVVPSMQDYAFRDNAVKNGCSTVVIEKGVYKVKDFVTTYNDSTPTPQYQWCRNLMIDFNIEYAVKLINVTSVLGFTIANDNDVVNATNVIKPKQLKALINDLIDQFVLRGLIVDAAFSKASISVTINSTNPNRLDSNWNYKRSGIGRILSTTVYAGFNFGTV